MEEQDDLLLTERRPYKSYLIIALGIIPIMLGIASSVWTFFVALTVTIISLMVFKSRVRAIAVAGIITLITDIIFTITCL